MPAAFHPAQAQSRLPPACSSLASAHQQARAVLPHLPSLYPACLPSQCAAAESRRLPPGKRLRASPAAYLHAPARASASRLSTLLLRHLPVHGAGESSPRSRAPSHPPTRQKYEHRAFRERAAAPHRRRLESATAASPCRPQSRLLSLLDPALFGPALLGCPSPRPRKRRLQRPSLRHRLHSPAGRRETRSTFHPDSTARPRLFQTGSTRAAHPWLSTATAYADRCWPSSPAPRCRSRRLSHPATAAPLRSPSCSETRPT